MTGRERSVASCCVAVEGKPACKQLQKHLRLSLNPALHRGVHPTVCKPWTDDTPRVRAADTRGPLAPRWQVVRCILGAAWGIATHCQPAG